MFSPSEVNAFKAETLARRFNLALGLNIIWHNEPFDAQKHARSYGTLLCGAVDNHEARLELSKAQNAVWVEAGNHATAGSVIIGNSNDKQAVVREIKAGRFHYLPTATTLFPSLLEPELTVASQSSCAERCRTRTPFSQLLHPRSHSSCTKPYRISQLLRKRSSHECISNPHL